MTNNKTLTAPAAAAPLTVVACEMLDDGRTTVKFSDGSTAVMIELDRSGYSLGEARRVYGRTTHLAGSNCEVALPCATEAQWTAFDESIIEDRREMAREEEAYRAEQYAMLEDKVEQIRRDFTLPRIPALQKLKDACNTYGFGYLFNRMAATI